MRNAVVQGRLLAGGIDALTSATFTNLNSNQRSRNMLKFLAFVAACGFTAATPLTSQAGWGCGHHRSHRAVTGGGYYGGYNAGFATPTYGARYYSGYSPSYTAAGYSGTYGYGYPQYTTGYRGYYGSGYGYPSYGYGYGTGYGYGYGYGAGYGYGYGTTYPSYYSPRYGMYRSPYGRYRANDYYDGYLGMGINNGPAYGLGGYLGF
jgi:hypothetical protein